MGEWKKRLQHKKVLVADGAWGTQLFQRGLQAGQAPESWNLERPEEVRAVAGAYVEAGADIILTNTFGGSPLKLEKSHLAKKVTEINRLGVELSCQAAAGKALVFASVGPTGEFMEPLGVITEKEMIENYVRQISAMVAAKPDALVIETMTDLAEACAALKAARECCDLPVVVSFTYDKGEKGYATMMGVRPQQAAETCQKAGADMIGANCGLGIEQMLGLPALIKPATDLPLWFKPNAGLPELIDGQTVFRQTPEMMARHVPALLAAGADVIGGCCGTTPEHIRRLAECCQSLR